ncbi:putative Wzz domain-containing protein [Gammaproteobacteria bacterium]
MTDNSLVEGAVSLSSGNATVRDVDDTDPVQAPKVSAQEYTADREDAPDEESILPALLALWNTVMMRKRLAVDIFVGCLTIALALALLSTPIYKSEILLSIITMDKTGVGGGLGGLGGIASFAGLGGFSGERGDAIAVLTSRALIESFIKKKNLLPVLFSNSWDEKIKTWKSDKKPTQGAAYRLFSKSICKVNEDKKTGLITLSIDWKDPEIAATWANDIVKEADLIRRRDAIEDAQRSIAFLETELRKTSIVETQQTIQQLMEVQVRKNMVANTAGRYTYKVIDPATVPDQKERPKRALMMIMGAFVGGMLGIFVPWSLQRYEKMRTQIRSYRQKIPTVTDSTDP